MDVHCIHWYIATWIVYNMGIGINYPLSVCNPTFFSISVEESYYMDDGCHSENNTPDDYVGYYEGELTEAGVRCCSTDESYAAGTICTTPDSCTSSNDLKNHADAEARCAAHYGMRLCTKDELLSDICCGTGGSCDSNLVWTSTAYGI